MWIALFFKVTGCRRQTPKPSCLDVDAVEERWNLVSGHFLLLLVSCMCVCVSLQGSVDCFKNNV